MAFDNSPKTLAGGRSDRSSADGLSLRQRIQLAAGRIRYQLAGAFLVAIIAPALVRFAFNEHIGESLQFRNSFLGSCWSLLLGYLIIRKVSAFPGVKSTAYIVPTFLGAFGLTMAFFFFFRINYSGQQLLLSFVLATVYFYFVLEAARGARKPILQLLLTGNGASLLSMRSVGWRVVDDTEHVLDSRPLVVDLKTDLGPRWEGFIARRALSGQAVFDARQVYESLSGRVQIKHISENAFGSLMPNSLYATAKRQIDLLLAILALIVLALPMLLIALVIRLDSPGPAIFRQQRMGLGARPFTVFKFRTMKQADAEPSLTAAMTADGDPRITRLGRVLRKTRLDELPQIFNILSGQMSWIGPRPEAVPLAELYQEKLPFYAYRHVVRPGITGWAQVNQGHVTQLAEVDHKLQYDFFYIKHFSLWLDLLVALKTVRVIVSGFGAR